MSSIKQCSSLNRNNIPAQLEDHIFCLCFREEFRTCHHKIYSFSVLIILRWRYLKCRERLSLILLICLKTDPPRNSIIKISPPPGRCFINLGRSTLITGEETGSPYHTLTNFVTNYLLSRLIFKGPFIFPSKNHLLSLRDLYTPSLPL